MKALCCHTDAGVQQPYKFPYLFERIVMNSGSLIDSLVAGCLIGRAGIKACLLTSEFPLAPFANLDVSLAVCRKAEIRCCVGRFSYLRRMVAWGVV